MDLHFRVPFYTFRDVIIMSVDRISNTGIKVSHWKMKHSVTFPVSGLVGDISKSVKWNTKIEVQQKTGKPKSFRPVYV